MVRFAKSIHLHSFFNLYFEERKKSGIIYETIEDVVEKQDKYFVGYQCLFEKICKYNEIATNLSSVASLNKSNCTDAI